MWNSLQEQSSIAGDHFEEWYKMPLQAALMGVVSCRPDSLIYSLSFTYVSFHRRTWSARKGFLHHLPAEQPLQYIWMPGRPASGAAVLSPPICPTCSFSWVPAPRTPSALCSSCGESVWLLSPQLSASQVLLPSPTGETTCASPDVITHFGVINTPLRSMYLEWMLVFSVFWMSLS